MANNDIRLKEASLLVGNGVRGEQLCVGYSRDADTSSHNYLDEVPYDRRQMIGKLLPAIVMSKYKH